jgi:hypothetical protein
MRSESQQASTKPGRLTDSRELGRADVSGDSTDGTRALLQTAPIREPTDVIRGSRDASDPERAPEWTRTLRHERSPTSHSPRTNNL